MCDLYLGRLARNETHCNLTRLEYHPMPRYRKQAYCPLVTARLCVTCVPVGFVFSDFYSIQFIQEQSMYTEVGGGGGGESLAESGLPRMPMMLWTSAKMPAFSWFIMDVF